MTRLCGPIRDRARANGVAHTNDYGPKSELWTRMFHFYALNRAEFLQHYHKRSNIETTFHMIKSKFGQRLRSRTLTAQFNEALCKVLCHDLCVVFQSVHELGIETSFGAEMQMASVVRLYGFRFSRSLASCLNALSCLSITSDNC